MTKALKANIIVKSKTREGLLSNTWNKLVKGYEYDNESKSAEWYVDGEYWCAKMKLKNNKL